MIESQRLQQVSLAATTAAATAAVAAVVGWLSAFSLHVAIVPLAAVWTLTFLVMGHRLIPVFFAGLAVILAGYMFAGRGFAHLGVPPLFVSEAVLFLALLVVIVKLSDTRMGSLHMLLIVFMLWGLIRTIPYVERDGLNAFRDAVVWGYGLFAIAISLAIRPGHFEKITAIYGRLAPALVCWTPILFILFDRFPGLLPKTLTGVTIPTFLASDIGVHVAGVAGFAILGLYTYHYRLSVGAAAGLAAIWCAGFIICSSVSRGAFLACVLVLAGSFFFRPSRLWLPVATFGVAAVIALAVINPTIDVRGRGRDISMRQLVSNTTSIPEDTSGSTEGNLAGTRRWRLEWWGTIIDYTLFGPYFWTGKGFGVNLADDDGFQVFGDSSLRSPHNTHLTVLARMGVPGMALWIGLNALFVTSLLRARVEAQQRRQAFRAAFIAWLLLYWVAMTVTGAFSLYLESPHQGIWYWTVFGLGLAVLRNEGARETVPPQVEPPRRRERRAPTRRALPAPGIAYAVQRRPGQDGAVTRSSVEGTNPA